ncbi:MAG: chemotaxis protein CheY [Hoeflea sp. BRH_c9]|nr:MAG: chemotaxis protein CheY [Hoeflea sp. BRH_c9]
MNRPLSGRRILVVEDEMLVLMDIEDMLADLGCEQVATAATVEKALALIDAQSFDAAMLDMNLNGVATVAVADALAARGVPFVLATGYTTHDLAERLKSRPLLQKPFRQEDLAQTMTILLSEAQTSQHFP